MNGIDQKEVKMLTKARLDQYIKDNELVPIGTELITVQGGVGKVISNTYGRSSVYLCEFVNGPQLSYTKEFKYIEDNIHTSLIDPTPSTVESPFSKEMLEQMVSDVEDIRKVVGYSDTRGKIISTCTHLLTNANEFPKMMEVCLSESANHWDGMKVFGFADGVYLVKSGLDDSMYIGYKHARPIEQKPKELKDLKEGDFFWDIETLEKREYQGRNNALIIYNKDGIDCVVQVEDFDNYFQLTPPTPEQFTAAEETAINEVKQRFEKARKEVGMDNIAKFVECIEKPNETFTMRNVTVGKDYEVVSEDSHDYILIDDNGETWYYIRTCFKEKEATNG